MTERVLCRFRSRRNEVQLVKVGDVEIVQKQYDQKDNYSRERKIYEMLQGGYLKHAQVTDCGSLWIRMTHLPGRNLVDVLDDQENSGIICQTVWEKLVRWLVDFNTITGLVMTDVNLRNFLYDPETDTLYGVDFEECAEGSLFRTAALLAAYITNYSPENTTVKREIAEYILQEFSCCLNIPMQELLMETERQEAFLLERRNKKK